MYYGLIWLAAIIVFLVLEAVTYQFICIWFAGGALGALAAYGLGASLTVQITVFVLVSVFLLIMTRPLVKKLTLGKKISTNADANIGKTAVITETVNNTLGTGRAKLEGMEWTARSSEDCIIEEGKTVTVEEISGVKLIVKEK